MRGMITNLRRDRVFGVVVAFKEFSLKNKENTPLHCTNVNINNTKDINNISCKNIAMYTKPSVTSKPRVAATHHKVASMRYTVTAVSILALVAICGLQAHSWIPETTPLRRLQK
mmetsp:Transcript_22915/g.43051  ORF Transcript_22915/g.43051 Transcript_22915/m.43051 type:complete len:114 (+) Transcript_22915:1125-1466(+)